MGKLKDFLLGFLTCFVILAGSKLVYDFVKSREKEQIREYTTYKEQNYEQVYEEM